MSKQTLDDLFEKYCLGDTTHIGESAYDTDKLVPAIQALIYQEQLSLLKRLLEKSVHLHANFSPEVIEAVPSEAIESEILELEAQK